MNDNKQARILIVDDDMVTRKTLAKVLKKSGYEIFEASNGMDSLDMYKQHQPDIILMDVIMPEMDGYEACTRLRKITDDQTLPILMLTGLNDVDSVDKAFDAGATDFITKPINWPLLEQRVRYALRTKQMHQAMQSQQIRLTQAQRIARLGYWEMSFTEQRIICSDELLDILNLDKSHNSQFIDEFVNLVHPDDRDAFNNTFKMTINDHKPYQIEHRLLLQDGSEIYVHQQAEIIRNSNDQPMGIMGTLQDISELKSAKALIQHQQQYNNLSDLPNRRLFTEQLLHSIQNTSDIDELTCIILIRIDKLTSINETLGHDMVDDIIIAYAERLKSLEGNFLLFHFSNNIFAIIANRLQSFIDISDIVYNIQSIPKKPFWLGEHELHITTSTGVSVFPLDSNNSSEILRGAENAMNRARELGGNQVNYYSEKMNKSANDRMNIETDMRKGLKRGEFVAYYQPQIEVTTGKVIGMEALVRWNHPENGLVSPLYFIPVAEESGLILKLGKEVLEQACRQTKLWTDMGLGELRVGVNLSTKQFINHDLHKEVINILEETGLPPSQLDLEITESIVVQDMNTVIPILNKFRELGITIAMDDFGTGYSSLSYIRDLPLDILKIDRSFIKDIGASDDGSIARAITAMAHSLGMRIIAEGVETVAQYDFMLEQKCTEIQGYLFSPPLPANEFEEYVIKRNKLSVQQNQLVR